MVDTATTRNRLRKQEVGTNVNSWGTNLNEALDVIDQCLDGVESINLGAASTYTLTTTNYTTADEAKQRVLQFTNGNSGGTDVVIPSVEHDYGIYNNSGYDIEVRTSAGTGPTIPTGYYCQVYCDGSNVHSRPLFVNGAVRGSDAVADEDFTTLLQVSNLIAAQLLAGDGSLLTRVDDTTRKFLGDALTVSGSLVKSITDSSGNLRVNIAFTFDEGNQVLLGGVLAV